MVMQHVNGLRARQADVSIPGVHHRILIELRVPFFEPKRQPFLGFAKDQVRVLVVNNAIRMVTACIQSHQNVILVGRAHKNSAQFKRPFGQICLGLKRPHVTLIFDRDHDDGDRRV